MPAPAGAPSDDKQHADNCYSADVTRTTRVELPRLHYSVIDTERGGKPAVVVVNDAIERFAHRDIFPWHLTIRIEARCVAENGMPTRSEVALCANVRETVGPFGITVEGETG